jgi:hypothetical protein
MSRVRVALLTVACEGWPYPFSWESGEEDEGGWFAASF